MCFNLNDPIVASLMNLPLLLRSDRLRWTYQSGNRTPAINPLLINAAAVNVCLLSVTRAGKTGTVATFCNSQPTPALAGASCSSMSRPAQSPGLNLSVKPLLLRCLHFQKAFQRTVFCRLFCEIISGCKGIKKIKGPGVMRCLEFTPR